MNFAASRAQPLPSGFHDPAEFVGVILQADHLVCLMYPYKEPYIIMISCFGIQRSLRVETESVSEISQPC